MSITSPKSRGNFNFNFKEGQYEEIFGERTRTEAKIVKSMPKDTAIFGDDPKLKAAAKIGREIKRMKECGEGHRVESEFAYDANKIHEKKIDPNLSKQMADDVIEMIKRR